MNLPSVNFWLIHLTGCLLGGALTWSLGVALHRWLRMSHASRPYWMGLWWLAILPTLAGVLLEVWMPQRIAALPMVLPLPVALEEGGGAGHSLAATPLAAFWGPSLGVVLTTVYLYGVVVALSREAWRTWSVARIVRAAQPIEPRTSLGPACAREAQCLSREGIALRVTTKAMSPFAVRWPRPTIVLPADALHQFNDRQLRLVVRHEAAHLRQRDPHRAALMKLVGVLLWFDPFVRLIAARVQMAAELRCDALALADESMAGRDFASAYLQTLRMTAVSSTHAPMAALTQRDLEGHKLRINHMLHGDTGRLLSPCLRAALLGGAFAIGASLAMVQMAVATPMRTPRQIAAQPSAPTPVAIVRANDEASSSSDQVRFTSPIASPDVTSHFGETGGIRQRPHRGTDFRARRGTPVLASAAGVVVAATERYPDGPNYGTVVVLDHGRGWQTLYAHLDGFDVRVGQRVAAGEVIARAGRSGKATGPHLHLEMLLNGQRVDPEQLLR